MPLENVSDAKGFRIVTTWMLKILQAFPLYRKSAIKETKLLNSMKEIKTVISRTYLPEETKGTLFVMEGCNKYLELVSLELPDKSNKSFISCIPTGEYDLEKITRPNGDPAFLIKNVPGRSDILIHIANFAAGKKIDLEGCIAPGMNFSDINSDGFADAESSTLAMNLLLAVLPKKSKLIII